MHSLLVNLRLSVPFIQQRWWAQLEMQIYRMFESFSSSVDRVESGSFDKNDTATV